MANFMGMALARDIRPRAAARGRAAAARAMLEGVRVYTSDQTHFSIARALDLLGFPPETLVVVASDERFRLACAPVAAAVARDRAAGLDAVRDRGGRRIDQHRLGRTPIGELADVAAAEDLWLHVDAAYGGAARLLRARRATACTDLDRADSVTVDPHKWFFQAYDIGGLLVRDGAAPRPRPSAAAAPEYYRGGESAGRRRQRGGRRARRPRRHGPAQLLQAQLRGHPPLARAQALDVVEAPRHRGFRPAHRGQRRPRGATSPAAAPESDDFEAIPEVPELSVVCFRHLPGGRGGGAGAAPAELDAHQDRLQRALEVVRRRLAHDDPPPRLDLAPSRDRQLPLEPKTHIDRLLETSQDARPTKPDAREERAAAPQRTLGPSVGLCSRIAARRQRTVTSHRVDPSLR